MEDEVGSQHKKRLQYLLQRSYCESRGIDMKYLQDDPIALSTQNQSVMWVFPIVRMLICLFNSVQHCYGTAKRQLGDA